MFSDTAELSFYLEEMDISEIYSLNKKSEQATHFAWLFYWHDYFTRLLKHLVMMNKYKYWITLALFFYIASTFLYGCISTL
jgi:hypothetical protein